MFNLHVMSAPKAIQATELIESLGGSAAVSRITGYSVQRVNNWKARGIPASAKVEFPALFWPQSPSGEGSAGGVEHAVA